jgi:hypothetical protein
MQIHVGQGDAALYSKNGTDYRPGPTRDWLKIKTASWKVANRDRGEMFR